ncbi:multidrug MFS transporter [Leptospira kobayashii]|uniref:Multidrug MFS transporter n=1 Tax=Leptospira kobayashii TaxID=1917830 RepID=A0ABM7UKX3_9LEPT|nr:DHA2 family efflux MFS transporter permease subunit [Leptospira kobayashii]BDA79559.1 multidrug MFS transporter [Leptospira kobayashii]
MKEENLLRERWLPALTVMMGTAAMVMSSTILNVAIPHIMKAFQMGHEEVQWISTGFLAAMTIAMLSTSWMVLRFGQKQTHIIALVLFLFASLLGGFSPDSQTLFLARILQGVAAGIIQPLSMITIFQVFPAEMRGKAMGIYGLGVILAPSVSPALGGILVDLYSWRLVFFMALPFCLAAFGLSFFYLPGKEKPTLGSDSKLKFDWLGIILLSFSILLLLDGLSQGRNRGWMSLPILLRLGFAFIFASLFLLRESKIVYPLLDLGIFKNKRFVSACIVSFFYGAGLYGSVYLVPLFVQLVAGFTAAQAGMLLIPGGFALGVIMLVAGRLTDMYQSYKIIIVGLSLFAISFFGLYLLRDSTYFLLIGILVTASRAALGFVIPALNAGAIQVLSREFIAKGSGTVNFIRTLGSSFGVNVFASLLDWREELRGGANLNAFQDVFLIVALVFTLSIIPCFFMKQKEEIHV